MKRYLIALPLLALSASALANTAVINFTGTVLAGSCPIVIKDPAGGSSGTIDMGEAMAGNFDQTGSEANYRDFAIEVDDPSTCPGWLDPGTNVAKVRFFGLAGGADNDELFALNAGGTTATGVALGIKDDAGTGVGHGGMSREYTLTGGQANQLAFTAFYKSTVPTVTAGNANADVSVEMTIN
ncbi:fimbrial protein [Pseudomonas japonica]|uniref:fimbrial protein n=1 Tax=Pseudomonas japonica TaxID=256466 RepID=UPI0015E2E1E4|nr:fimbrial protein [Pseudomonas japonica]MBA1287311.1 fimbrial protein [Pseudomonas japonica]